MKNLKKYIKKTKPNSTTQEPQSYYVPKRENFSLDLPKKEIILIMAEGDYLAYKILRRIIMKNFYWSLLISNLDDMNIRGHQIASAWDVCNYDPYLFCNLIKKCDKNFIDGINLASFINNKFDKAVTKGAVNLRKNSNTLNKLYFNENDLNSLLENFKSRFTINTDKEITK